MSATNLKPAQAPPNGALVNIDYLFETIICDLQWNALHIGALTTLIAACLREDPVWTLRPWRHVLVEDGGVMQLALRYCDDVGIDPAVARQMSKLYGDLSAGKAMLAPLMKTAKHYAASERDLLAKAAGRWKALAQEAIRVFQELDSTVRRRLHPSYSDDSRVLVAFLGEALSGAGIAKISEFGEIHMPTLKQRRRSPRVEVRRSCRLLLGDRIAPATLEDVSLNGLGVVTSHPLAIDQKLQIELDDGRRLDATVARSVGERVGLLLARPLSGADPLFRRG